MYMNGFTLESVMKQIKARNLGYPSYYEEEVQCMYRAPDGNQCLVGCFIPDELYEETFEGSHSDDVFDKMPEIMPMVKPIMHQVQRFHDEYIDRRESTKTFFKDIELKLISLEKEWEAI